MFAFYAGDEPFDDSELWSTSFVGPRHVGKFDVRIDLSAAVATTHENQEQEH